MKRRYLSPVGRWWPTRPTAPPPKPKPKTRAQVCAALKDLYYFKHKIVVSVEYRRGHEGYYFVRVGGYVRRMSPTYARYLVSP